MPPRRRFGTSTALLITLVAIVVVVAALAVIVGTSSSGPGTDTKLAERSLVAAFSRTYPSSAPVTAYCEGIRDGSDFFNCRISRSGKIVNSYAIGYNEAAKSYRAESSRPREYRSMRYAVVG